jgi:hypothetical protein
MPRNWKDWATTVPGVLAGVALSFVLFAPELFDHWPWVLQLAKFAAIGGLAALGVNATSGKAKRK